MQKEKVVHAIYMYGCYPALYSLRELQDKEQYEDCKVIKEALDEILNGRNLGISTKVDDNSLDENYRSVLNEMSNKELLHNNMFFYIFDFQREVGLISV